MKKDFLEVGEIVGTHGVRGEMRVYPWADSGEFLCGFKTLYFNEETQTYADKRGLRQFEVNINDGKIDYTIEKELGIEIIGETKMKISIEEDEEPWDIIDDDEEVTDKIEQEIDDNVEEKFI